MSSLEGDALLFRGSSLNERKYDFIAGIGELGLVQRV